MKYLTALLISCNLINDYNYTMIIKNQTFICEHYYGDRIYGDCKNTETKEEFSEITIGNNVTVWRKTK